MRAEELNLVIALGLQLKGRDPVEEGARPRGKRSLENPEQMHILFVP